MADMGIVSSEHEGACVLLAMDAVNAPTRHCLCSDLQPCDGDEGTLCKEMGIGEIVNSIVGTVQKIHQGQTVLIPAGKWRSIFDAVAFSMAGDELWQEFDASATIRLNTRDPLLFGFGETQTLSSLLTALMNDGETLEQSVFLIPAGVPLLMHIKPGGPVKFWFGNLVLADEVSEAYAE